MKKIFFVFVKLRSFDRILLNGKITGKFEHLHIEFSEIIFQINNIKSSLFNIFIKYFESMSNIQKQKKRQQYTRDQFSDKQVYNEIKDDIKQIRDRNLKQVQQDSLINKLYEDKKKQMKITKMQFNKQSRPKQNKQKPQHQLGQYDEQEGQIPIVQTEQIIEQGAPSINDLGKHISPITIPRNKMAELLKSRKFEDSIKGCFVRYKSQNSNSYMLGLIIGIIEGQKQYLLNNIKIRTQLRLQQSTTQIIKLSLDHISNQHPPGNLQISKWLQTNKTKIPKQKQLKDKLQQLNNLIHGKVSSLEINQNLLKQAEKAANQHDKGEGSYNISELIFFMKNHIHNLAVTLQQIQGIKDKHNEFEAKKKEKASCDIIFSRLLQKQTQIKNQNSQKQKQDKKVRNKGYSDYIYNDRKQDKIKEVWHKKIVQLTSQKGWDSIRQQLHKAHQNFDIQVNF